MNQLLLSSFTPSMMSRNALEALFIQREHLLAQVLGLVRASVLGGSKHHVLLVGPRGIGKTHFISLIYHRVSNDPELRDRLAVAWMREEEWGVTSFLDLLIRVHQVLELESADPNGREKLDEIRLLSSNEAERRAGELLRARIGDRTLVLLIENLDDMFNSMEEIGQKKFRAFVQEKPFWAIVGTAQSLAASFARRAFPFFGFFRIEQLGELSLEQATEFLQKLAAAQGNEGLAKFIRTPLGRARIRAVHHLAGGNHRVYVILAQFLNRSSLDELVGPLMKTIDDLTPYYQSRMAMLSPQQRKVVEVLAEARGAVRVKDVAARGFLTQQTASSQLGILRQRGYVRATTVGRESYYELAEPLMRLCIDVKRSRGEPIRVLVEFLRLWYSVEDLEERLRTAHLYSFLEREYLRHAAIKAREGADATVVACVADYRRLIQQRAFEAALEVARELGAHQDGVEAWEMEAHALSHLKKWEETLAASERVLAVEGDHASGLFFKAAALDHLGRSDDALRAYDALLKIDQDSAAVWNNRGWLLHRLGRTEEALGAFERATEVSPDDAHAWLGKGQYLGAIGRHEDAIRALRRGIRIEPRNGRLRAAEAEALHGLGRNEEAVAALAEAVKRDDGDAIFWLRRGDLLLEMGHSEEALASYDKSVSLGGGCEIIDVHRAEAMFRSGQWGSGLDQLQQIFEKMLGEDRRDAGLSTRIVGALLGSFRGKVQQRAEIDRLVRLYAEHEAVAILGRSLVRAIGLLKSPEFSATVRREWLEGWRGAASGHKELELPIRLLEAATQYYESGNERVLLSLATEERDILQGAMGDVETGTQDSGPQRSIGDRGKRGRLAFAGQGSNGSSQSEASSSNLPRKQD